MSKYKDLKKGLIDLGYTNQNKMFIKQEDDKKFGIVIYKGIFGKINMIGFCYVFKEILSEEYLDEVFEKGDELIKGLNCNIEMGVLDSEFVEASLFPKKNTDLSAESIDRIMNTYIEAIVPFCNSYFEKQSNLEE